ncbi:hypothetical protein JY97_10595 [Alkalispirochaeta odontotermitis]|nr:hypothetical protein JY97_10595 [Alkalispirochaeta odontotermitis]CAB1079410.1 Alcohol dehydrogenase (EC [Olavius algarvensis Delta 1 endosymbiont]
MKAAVYKAKNQPLVIEDIPRPVPGPGQVLVQVKACGICGSDIHASEADWTPTDIVMGHEFSGVVAELGDGVDGWCIGQRVVPLPQISCGKCAACAAGSASDCENLEIIDYNPKYNGGYAEYIVVGQADMLALPPEIGFEEAAALEPLAVALDSVRRAKLQIGDAVLIVGAGPIGLAIAQWTKYFGIAHVVVSEMNPRRLEIAQKMGATAIIDAGQETDVIAAFETESGTRPGIIFEAVGVPGLIQRCIEMAKPRTKIVVVGVCQQADLFEPLQCTLKALDLIFPFGYSVSDYEFILELMQQGRITASPLISHKISLEQLPEMFEKLRKPADECKVIVQPTRGF